MSVINWHSIEDAWVAVSPKSVDPFDNSVFKIHALRHDLPGGRAVVKLTREQARFVRDFLTLYLDNDDEDGGRTRGRWRASQTWHNLRRK